MLHEALNQARLTFRLKVEKGDGSTEYMEAAEKFGDMVGGLSLQEQELMNFWWAGANQAHGIALGFLVRR